MTPINVRNKNPLNIRPGLPWEGLANPSESGGFAVFTSPVFGFRAAFRNYIVKADRGVDTIRELINEWAPAADNNDDTTYIARVCKMSNYGPDEHLSLKTWQVASAICYAQTVVETGQSFEAYWKLSDMSEGAYRAGIADAPAPVAHKVMTSITGSGAAIAAGATAAAPAITTAMNTTHSTIVQVGLGMIAMALSGAAVYFGTRSKQTP